MRELGVRGAFGTVEALAASLGLDLEEVLRTANRKAMSVAPTAVTSGVGGTSGTVAAAPADVAAPVRAKGRDAAQPGGA